MAKIKSPRRKFSHLKLLLLLTYALNFDVHIEKGFYKQNFRRDLSFCPSCFCSQVTECLTFFDTLKPDPQYALQNFAHHLPLSRRHHTNFVCPKENATIKIIAKSLANNKELKSLQSHLSIQQLADKFQNEEQLNGFQFCPYSSLPRFVRHFTKNGGKHRNHDELAVWLYIVQDIQPLLLPYLDAKRFPVPHNFASCGFTLFQEHAGKSLMHFYKAGFETKARIAMQLIQLAIKFAYGFNGFNIYLTDLNSDNVVYNEALDRLYFIDMNSVFIVDSLAATAIGVHRHVPLECENCFAYAPQDICKHTRSDINIYAACQLLREDLSGNRKAGFLYPVPHELTESYPELLTLLDECVECHNTTCKNRFSVAFDLIDVLETISGH